MHSRFLAMFLRGMAGLALAFLAGLHADPAFAAERVGSRFVYLDERDPYY